jgi:hypothetical protein
MYKVSVRIPYANFPTTAVSVPNATALPKSLGFLGFERSKTSEFPLGEETIAKLPETETFFEVAPVFVDISRSKEEFASKILLTPPTTESDLVGVEVPIPTLPAEVTVKNWAPVEDATTNRFEV